MLPRSLVGLPRLLSCVTQAVFAFQATEHAGVASTAALPPHVRAQRPTNVGSQTLIPRTACCGYRYGRRRGRFTSIPRCDISDDVLRTSLSQHTFECSYSSSHHISTWLTILTECVQRCEGSINQGFCQKFAHRWNVQPTSTLCCKFVMCSCAHCCSCCSLMRMNSSALVDRRRQRAYSHAHHSSVAAASKQAMMTSFNLREAEAVPHTIQALIDFVSCVTPVRSFRGRSVFRSFDLIGVPTWRTGGWMDGRMDGMDGWMDGQGNSSSCLLYTSPSPRDRG